MKKAPLLFILLITFCSSIIAQGDYKTESEIFYRNASESGDAYKSEKCVLDVYYPENVENFPTVVWFFGGGLTGGTKYIPEAFKEKGIGVIAVDYRLSPKVNNPAYTEDAAAAVAWTFKNIGKYGGDVSKIYVAGHSSGAYLVSMIGLDKQYLNAHDINADDIAGLFPISGQCITHETVRRERGIPSSRPMIDAYSPTYHVRADAPPITLITGGKYLDNPARYEENVYMHRVLEVVGHPNVKLMQLEGFNHGGVVDPACQIIVNSINN